VQLTFANAGTLLLSFLVPLMVILVAMPPYLRYLRRRGMVVDDVHKTPPTKVPSPIGPVLLAGVIAGEAVAYLGFHSLVFVAMIGVAVIAFAIGLVDDLYVMGGKTKPLLLLLTGVPLALSVFSPESLYEPSLAFPLLGRTAEHFLIYTVLLLVAFPIVANAFNMMDSFNGELSWFTLLSSMALLFGVVLRTAYTSWNGTGKVAATLPLLAVAVGFLVFNRYPSRGFDGDSGALMLGALFAALAITDGVEIAAIVAIVPAVLNSFYTLWSVRGFVERRRMAARPTIIGSDGMLYAAPGKSAPNTLVRLILLAGPLTEEDLVKSVAILTAVGCLLSAGISIMTWVF